MKVKVKYFGMLSEVMGKAEEEIMLREEDTIQDVHNLLAAANEELTERTFKIAHNTSMNANLTTVLAEGDELSFLPPFAGG